MKISEGKAGDMVPLEELEGPVLVVERYQLAVGQPAFVDGQLGAAHVILSAEGFDAATRAPLACTVALPAAAVAQLVGELRKAVQE